MKKAFENPKFGNSLKTCESKHQRIKMPAYNISKHFSTSSFCRTMVPACREINKAKAERDDYLSRKEAESHAAIVGAMIEQRNALGISQRELANICGIPQSSVARIESFKTTPNLDTLLKIFQPLGLKLTVSASKQTGRKP